MRRCTYFFVMILMACTSPETDQTVVAEENKKEIVLHYYGDTISEDAAIASSALMANMEGKDSLGIKLKATINETCSKKGCWMDVDLGDGQSMMVRFKDYGFFVPKDGMQGKTAVFKGMAYRDTVPVADLKHYAEDAGKTAEEIEKITEPEITMSFEATGVIIK